MKLLSTKILYTLSLISLSLLNPCRAAQESLVHPDTMAPRTLPPLPAAHRGPSAEKLARLTNFHTFPTKKLEKIRAWETGMARRLNEQALLLDNTDPEKKVLENLRDASRAGAQEIFEHYLAPRYRRLTKKHACADNEPEAFHYTILRGRDVVHETVANLLSNTYYQQAIDLCFQAGEELGDSTFIHRGKRLVRTYRHIIDAVSTGATTSPQIKRLIRRPRPY